MQILLGSSDFFVARIQNSSTVESGGNINELPPAYSAKAER
jgi:hypothetical protein